MMPAISHQLSAVSQTSLSLGQEVFAWTITCVALVAMCWAIDHNRRLIESAKSREHGCRPRRSRYDNIYDLHDLGLSVGDGAILRDEGAIDRLEAASVPEPATQVAGPPFITDEDRDAVEAHRRRLREKGFCC